MLSKPLYRTLLGWPVIINNIEAVECEHGGYMMNVDWELHLDHPKFPDLVVSYVDDDGDKVWESAMSGKSFKEEKQKIAEAIEADIMRYMKKAGQHGV